MFDKEKTVCFTGHRPNKLNGYEPEKNYLLLIKLKELIEKEIVENNNTNFISGMALGVDIWAAKIVLKLKEKYSHIRLICAIPCLNHSSRWNEKDKKEWQRVVELSDFSYYVSNEEYTNWCMQKRNEWMVDNSNKTIAVWDGTKGGTGNCVNYAIKKNKEIIYINPNDYK